MLNDVVDNKAIKFFVNITSLSKYINVTDHICYGYCEIYLIMFNYYVAINKVISNLLQNTQQLIWKDDSFVISWNKGILIASCITIKSISWNRENI